MENDIAFDEVMMRKYPLCFASDEDGFPVGPECGFGCPEGWEPLVEALCSRIHSYIQHKPSAKIEIGQVKSKFGALRFYYDGGDDFIRGMVAFAEVLSCKVSEDSGKWGILQQNPHGYYRTMTPDEGKAKGFS
jgi:hypothetical protein